MYCPPGFIDAEDGNFIDGVWRQDEDANSGMQPIGQTSSNRYTKKLFPYHTQSIIIGLCEVPLCVHIANRQCNFIVCNELVLALLSLLCTFVGTQRLLIRLGIYTKIISVHHLEKFLGNTSIYTGHQNVVVLMNNYPQALKV